MFSLKFSTDNASFAENGEHEVSRILRCIAAAVDNGKTVGKVFDGNGNSCGSWDLDLPEPVEAD